LTDLQFLINNLNITEKERLIKEGFINSAFFDEQDNLTKEYQWTLKLGGQKFHKINHGSSGVFMIEINTGEIYNIKAYGVPDYNKKLKANLGNIKDYDSIEKIRFLLSKQYNYLR
jgi:hypothetical protein